MNYITLWLFIIISFTAFNVLCIKFNCKLVPGFITGFSGFMLLIVIISEFDNLSYYTYYDPVIPFCISVLLSGVLSFFLSGLLEKSK